MDYPVLGKAPNIAQAMVPFRLDANGNAVPAGGTAYETVAASQTDQVLGTTGAAGDYLAGVLVVPATTGAGTVSVKDGAGSAIVLFTGGGTLADLKPFFVPVGACSASGAWKVTTGANVSAIGVGAFT